MAGEYGEPLTVEMRAGLVNIYGRDGQVVHWSGYRSFQERAVACTNALDGIANVAAVGELLAQLRDCLASTECDLRNCETLEAALASLDAPAP